MKRALWLVLILAIACEKFPANPEGGILEMMIHFQYTGTQYVPATPDIEGLEATKMNLLAFQFQLENFSTHALEIHAIVVLEGPPESREHLIVFRTDCLSIAPKEPGFEFPTYYWIDADSIYTLVRPKFPTNEYMPFDGDQGKVANITIVNIYALDTQGKRSSVPFTGL